MKLKSIKRGIKFSEKPFMKCYIDKNTELRAKGKTKFEKEFFKLMNNSVFGKTMENLRKRVSIELVKDAEKAEKLVKQPNFVDVKIFDEFLIAIKMKKTRVVMNKPIFAGMTILDLSKLLMFDFHYGYVKTSGRKFLSCTQTQIRWCWRLKLKIYSRIFQQMCQSGLTQMIFLQSIQRC